MSSETRLQPRICLCHTAARCLSSSIVACRLHVDRTALAFGAAGLCLGSLLTYSWLYSTAPQQKPRQRRRTHSSTGAESEPGTPRSGAESVSAFDSPQLLLVVNKELKLVRAWLSSRTYIRGSTYAAQLAESRQARRALRACSGRPGQEADGQGQPLCLRLGEHAARLPVGVQDMHRSLLWCIQDKAGGAKVCAGVESETDLIDLREKARQAGVTCSLLLSFSCLVLSPDPGTHAGLSTFAVQDRSGSNGKTHVSVLAVGPGSEHIMAEVLGQLCILS